MVYKNLICSCVSFYISDCISLFNLSTKSVHQSLQAYGGERWRNQQRFTFQQKASLGYYSLLLSCSKQNCKKEHIVSWDENVFICEIIRGIAWVFFSDSNIHFTLVGDWSCVKMKVPPIIFKNVQTFFCQTNRPSRQGSLSFSDYLFTD